MALLTPHTLSDIQRALAEAELDGWLLFEFRGLNPVALQMLGIDALLTRRIFAWIPREGLPVAVTHNIEQTVWREWPEAWKRERYSAWTTLETLVQKLVGGRRIAMEYSEGNAVPYLDRVPAGMLELVRRSGATVVSSADLVSRFNATWTPDELARHRRAAEHVAAIAQEALGHAVAAVQRRETIHEHDVQARILDAFARAGLETYSPPNVSVGANAADPHYEPSAERPQLITAGNVILIDLWAREPHGPYADQTWMAVTGAPTERALTIWTTIRDARDAAVTYIREHLAAGTLLRGAEVDDVARAVIEQRGFGEYFTHRTGHSIDAREIHGSGPNLDNLETRDVRLLIPGVGFSIEPGVYIRGEIGMRTEVNAYVDGTELVITPSVYQHELIVA
jgi:Xaa-Pro aminopeptidase